MREQERDPHPGDSASCSAVRDGFLAACQEVGRQGISALVDGLFVNAEESLYTLADKTASNSLYAGYFDAVRKLRRQHDGIRRRFLALLFTDSAGAPDAGPLSETVSSNDARGREETLVLANLVEKAETRYRTELSALRQHLAALSGQDRAETSADPLGPKAICGAFRAALRPVADLDLAITLVIYRAFDQQVLDRLGPIYGRCLGLLPRAYGQADTGGPTAHANPSAATVAAASPAWDQAGQPPSFDQLRRLLQPTAVHTEGGTTTSPTKAFLARLAGPQAPGLTRGPASATHDIKDRMRHPASVAMAQTTRWVLDPRDQDTVALIALLFERILADNALPEVFRALIAQLQIPVLKVALEGPAFFDDANHPARALLNHLAEAAVGWDPQGDAGSADLYRLIDGIVERILNELDQDLGLFRRLDAKLLAYLEEERHRADARCSRALQDLAAREHQRSAERAVDRVIAERLGARGRVPGPVAELVRDGWRRVLLAAHRQAEEDGEPWRQALAVLDRLLWSVQPKADHAERRALLQAIPGLLRTLREALAEVSYDPRRLARAFKELQALHIIALRGSPSVPLGPTQRGALPEWRPELRIVEKTTPPSLPTEPADEGRPPWLRLGDWVELRRAGSAPRALRLAGQSPGGVLLLVDRRGEPVLELEAAALAEMVSQGSAVIRGEPRAHPLVDRALAAIARSLAEG